MEREQEPTPSKAPARSWQKTSFANLVRYVPSGTYFARVRVNGKLIRRSLKTASLSVAKLRLSDFEKQERAKAVRTSEGGQDKLTFGDVLNLYSEQFRNDGNLKPSSKHYREEILVSINKSWPGLLSRKVRDITEVECQAWAAKFSSAYSAPRHNAAVATMRGVFETAIKLGALYQNPAQSLKRARVQPKHLLLPDDNQFHRFLKLMEEAGGRDSINCAELVRFLAFGGFRIGEAIQITWADCDFAKGEIVVRGDPETGTKNWSVRRVPMIPDMIKLLERLRQNRLDEPPEGVIMQVKECFSSMTRAAKLVPMPRITHHDLRHLFATRCIESGVDIPTVSRWLGHKDGGALAMKTYGHLRAEHSVSMAKKVTFFSPGIDPVNPQGPMDGSRALDV